MWCTVCVGVDILACCSDVLHHITLNTHTLCIVWLVCLMYDLFNEVMKVRRMMMMNCWVLLPTVS